MAIPKTQIILLPGLDGTSRLFNRFVAAAPPGLSLTPVVLPSEVLTYEQLADGIAGTLPHGRLILIAESYSGPLAVALTERRPVVGLILCNSFIAAPRPRAFRWLASPILFRVPTPAPILRRFLLGDRADDALVSDVAAAVASIPPAVLASRLRSVLTVDYTNTFARCVVPTLYLRGTEDWIVPDSAWRKMSRLRDMTTVTVQGPHLLLQVSPVAAWKAIQPFIESSCRI